MQSSWFSRLQLYPLAIDDKSSITAVVDGLRISFSLGISPGVQNLKDKEIVLANEPGVGYLAFEIGKALGHQRGSDAFGGERRDAEPPELVHVPARAVANSHNLGSQFHRRNSDNAFPGLPQRGKAGIGVADDAGDQWRLKLNHRKPRHRHDVGAMLVGCCQQNHRPRFQ